MLECYRWNRESLCTEQEIGEPSSKQAKQYRASNGNERVSIVIGPVGCHAWARGLQHVNPRRSLLFACLQFGETIECSAVHPLKMIEILLQRLVLVQTCREFLRLLLVLGNILA